MLNKPSSIPSTDPLPRSKDTLVLYADMHYLNESCERYLTTWLEKLRISGPDWG